MFRLINRTFAQYYILGSTANATLCLNLITISVSVDSFVIRHKRSQAIFGDALLK